MYRIHMVGLTTWQAALNHNDQQSLGFGINIGFQRWQECWDIGKQPSCRAPGDNSSLRFIWWGSTNSAAKLGSNWCVHCLQLKSQLITEYFYHFLHFNIYIYIYYIIDITTCSYVYISVYTCMFDIFWECFSPNPNQWRQGGLDGDRPRLIRIQRAEDIAGRHLAPHSFLPRWTLHPHLGNI